MNLQLMRTGPRHRTLRRSGRGLCVSAYVHVCVHVHVRICVWYVPVSAGLHATAWVWRVRGQLSGVCSHLSPCWRRVSVSSTLLCSLGLLACEVSGDSVSTSPIRVLRSPKWATILGFLPVPGIEVRLSGLCRWAFPSTEPSGLAFRFLLLRGILELHS